MKKTLFALLLLCTVALLAFTNPDDAAFEAWVKARIEDRMATETGDGALGRILTDMGSSVVGSIASRAAERDNWALFSVYTIDLGADDRDHEKWRFVGIAGTFVEIATPESAR